MQINHQAIAGTLESSDVLVEMIPHDSELVIELQSPVEIQFGESIRHTVAEVLAEHGVKSGIVRLEDRGALDCTIRARLEACLLRASREEER